MLKWGLCTHPHGILDPFFHCFSQPHFKMTCHAENSSAFKTINRAFKTLAFHPAVLVENVECVYVNICLIVVLWTRPSHCNCTLSTTHRLEDFENMSLIERRPVSVLGLTKRFLPLMPMCCTQNLLHTQVKSKGLVTLKAVRDKKIVKPVKTQCVHWTRLLDVKMFLCALTLTCISLSFTNSYIHRNRIGTRSDWLEWCDMTFSLLWRALGDKEWNVSKSNI